MHGKSHLWLDREGSHIPLCLSLSSLSHGVDFWKGKGYFFPLLVVAKNVTRNGYLGAKYV